MLDEVSSLPIQGVSINWDKIDSRSYLRGIEAIKDLDYLAFNKNITIFVGENGSGKSTMLEAIAVNYGFNPEGGTKNYNFRGNGLYLLDEPEAALSPQRQLTLLLEIVNCAKEDTQFIMVTHSPILLGIPGAEILSFDNGQIHPIDYEDTDSYQITKMFIENKEQLLKRLLEE